MQEELLLWEQEPSVEEAAAVEQHERLPCHYVLVEPDKLACHVCPTRHWVLLMDPARRDAVLGELHRRGSL